jgi:hypothetical protein
MSRFLKPEIVRINLTGGDWITVKRQLTAGEQRRAFARTVKTVKAGAPLELDLEKAGLATLVEYLIDWSFTDEAGKAVVIRDTPADIVMDILNNLDADSYQEITDAINTHEKSVADEKKTRATESVSQVT